MTIKTTHRGIFGFKALGITRTGNDLFLVARITSFVSGDTSSDPIPSAQTDILLPLPMGEAVLWAAFLAQNDPKPFELQGALGVDADGAIDRWVFFPITEDFRAAALSRTDGTRVPIFQPPFPFAEDSKAVMLYSLGEHTLWEKAAEEELAIARAHTTLLRDLYLAKGSVEIPTGTLPRHQEAEILKTLDARGWSVDTDADRIRVEP